MVATNSIKKEIKMYHKLKMMTEMILNRIETTVKCGKKQRFSFRDKL